MIESKNKKESRKEGETEVGREGAGLLADGRESLSVMSSLFFPRAIVQALGTQGSESSPFLFMPLFPPLSEFSQVSSC